MALNGLLEDAVQTLDEIRGILERYALHQQSLVKKQPRGILCNSILWTGQQLLHDLVIGIDLERGLRRGKVLLSHGT